MEHRREILKIKPKNFIIYLFFIFFIIDCKFYFLYFIDLGEWVVGSDLSVFIIWNFTEVVQFFLLDFFEIFFLFYFFIESNKMMQLVL